MRPPFLACLALVCLLAACRPLSPRAGAVVEPSAPQIARSDQPRLAPDAAPAELTALVAGNNAFAFELYQGIRDGEENLLYSPFSISQALAMVYAGAHAETARQIAATLHFTLPQERLHAAFNALDQELAGRARITVPDESDQKKTEVAFEMRGANAVWGQRGLPYRAGYLAVLAQNYGAGMQLADLKGNPGEAVAAINQWASQETAGQIPEIVNVLQPDAGLVLANAIYFNARWALPFKESDPYDEPFYLLNGEQMPVPMMHQRNHFRYMEGDGYQAVELPYLNRTVAMVILLSADGRFRELEQRLTGSWVQEVVGKLGEREVMLTMPKFTYAPELPLTGILRDMGMPDAFAREAADFSGIVERTPAYWLYIGGVWHKSFIDVNELRTEAAAVTVVGMPAGSAPAEEPPIPIVMKIDRPFIFVIRDIETNLVLFVGRVMNPVGPGGTR